MAKHDRYTMSARFQHLYTDAEVDPNFSTDEYDISNMEPSPPQEDPTSRCAKWERGRRRGRTNGKVLGADLVEVHDSEAC